MTSAALPALRNDTVIARLEAARTALSEAKTIQQSKSIADVAAAAEIYARRQKLGEEAIDFAHAVKIEALRKLGEILKETPKNEGRRMNGRDVGGSLREPPTDDRPTLAELGVDKKTSAMAQKLADLPDKDFEAVRDDHAAVGKAIAKVASTRAPKPKVVAADPKFEKLYEEVKAELGETKDSLAEMRDLAQSAKAFEEKQEFKEMQVLRLELRSCKRRRDELMRENAELKKQVGFWKKKAEKK
jgi:hypothetical protein